MLEYRFYTNQIGTPQFDIKDELQGLNELGSCSTEYLPEIITSLYSSAHGHEKNNPNGIAACSEQYNYPMPTYIEQ